MKIKFWVLICTFAVAIFFMISCGAQPAPNNAAVVTPQTQAAADEAPAPQPVADTAQEAATNPTESETTPAEEAAEEITLRVMDNWGGQTDSKGPPLQAAFDDVMATYPNITVQEEVFGDHEIPVKVSTMYLAGDEPDIVLQNMHQSALEWLDDGVAVDVKGLAQEWGLYDQLKPEAIAEWTDAQGRLRAFPLEGYTWPVWYNTKILQEVGVEGIPQTTDELLDAAKKVRAAGYQPYATGGSDWTGQFDLFQILTTMLTDDEIRDLYSHGGWSANPNAVAGIELFVKLRDEGLFVDDVEGMTSATRNEMFFAEKAAFMHGGAWFFSELPEAVRDHVVLGGFPLPPNSVRQKPVIYASFEGKGLWITRNGAQKADAVEKFVKLFYQPKTMARFVEQAGMTSPLINTPVDDSKLNSLFVQTMQFGDKVEVALMHKIYVPAEIDENLRRVANEAFVPGTSAETIIANLDAVYEDMQ